MTAVQYAKVDCLRGFNRTQSALHGLLGTLPHSTRQGEGGNGPRYSVTPIVKQSPRAEFTLVCASPDIFTHGSASFSDFMRIRHVEPNVLDRVRLPVLNYTLSPHKRPFKAYVGEFLDMVARIQSGNMRWPLLQETVLPKMRDVTRSIGPSTWSLEMKVQVLTYALRAATRHEARRNRESRAGARVATAGAALPGAAGCEPCQASGRCTLDACSTVAIWEHDTNHVVIPSNL